MKLRKKLLSLGLATAMVLPLVACGGKSEDSDGGAQEASSSSASTEIPTIDSITLKTSADSEGYYRL